MDTISVPTQTSVRLHIDEELYKTYQEAAEAHGTTAEQAMAERLRQCQGHGAARPLYFNDQERGDLEILLGGRVLKDANHALECLKSFACLRLVGDSGKIIKIQLNQSQLSRMKTRFRRDKPFEPQVAEKVIELLEKYFRGEI